MNLTPTQIIIIGAAIVFGLPITIGIIMGHFFGPWLGVAIAGLILLLVVVITHKQLIKKAREREKEDKDNHA